ncbi:MAG: WD40 repeat domain-containing protein [Treponema sp.]|nr:WD40 repeat domain-containing protein [Treponema sp.]
MKSKKTLSFLITFGIIFIILYIIFSAKPLGLEYQFNPDWKINISQDVTASQSDIAQILKNDEKKLYFKLGRNIGYFSEDGQITLNKSFPSKVAISEHFYTLYNADGTNFTVYDNNGAKLCTINDYGYPMFDEDRIFLFLPGGASFSKYNTDGNLSWTVENTIPLTAFSSNEYYTAAGYADGSIKVFDNSTGKAEISFAPGGSDYPIILGLDISSDCQYVASVSGHEKQRFVLARKDENQPKIIFHAFLDSNLSRRTFVKFSKNGKQVFYNYENFVGIYDLEKKENYTIPVDTKILNIEESENLFFLLGKNENKAEYTVYVIERTNTLEGSFNFKADSAFIKAADNYLFVGKDNTISRISLKRE